MTHQSPPNDPTLPHVRKAASATDVLKALGRGRVLIALVIGFGSGLPFLLTGATLSLWLREGGTELAAIGFISWVGLAYSLKFLWAPVVDRLDVPFLGRFGRRRGWMLLSRNWAWWFAGMALTNEILRATLSFDAWLAAKVWGVTILTLLFSAANVPMLMKHGLGNDPAPVTPQE